MEKYKLNLHYFKLVFFAVFVALALSCNDKITTVSGEVCFPDRSMCQAANIELRQMFSDGGYSTVQWTTTNQDGKYELVVETESGVYKIFAAVSYISQDQKQTMSFEGESLFRLISGEHHKINVVIFQK